ncbi:hypothetical protein JTB14_017583 [Gonioctena quinquepunctata]|nr:hypothetical protein JTB14_017583 [Gonioctena quinquepunctata]
MRYRTLKIYQQNIGGITMNLTTTASLTQKGAVASDGTCEGSTYHENGPVWRDVVIIATIKIQVTDYLAKMKLDENEISCGVVQPFLKAYCFDTNLGETTWEVSPLQTCEERLSVFSITDRLRRSRISSPQNKSSLLKITLKYLQLL